MSEARAIQGARRMVDEIKQQPSEGVSMVYTFEKEANANAPAKSKTQLFRNDSPTAGCIRTVVRQHDAAERAVDIKRTLPRSAITRGEKLYTLHEDLIARRTILHAKMHGKLRKCKNCLYRRPPSTSAFREQRHVCARHLRRVQVRRGQNSLHLFWNKRRLTSSNSTETVW